MKEQFNKGKVSKNPKRKQDRTPSEIALTITREQAKAMLTLGKEGTWNVVNKKCAAKKKRKKTFVADRRSNLLKKRPMEEDIFEKELDRNNIKYVPQYTFSGSGNLYYVDFFLPDTRIVVEIDGGYHQTNEQKDKDEKRTRHLRKAHRVNAVVRFANVEVNTKMDSVIDRLKKTIDHYSKC